jgi:hypothetical protein
LKCFISTARAPLLGISSGALAPQSQPSTSFCHNNPNHEDQYQLDTNVSQSLESEFVYSLIFYRFSLVSKQKIRLVSLLLFSMLILHHICLNYRFLCLRMKGCRLMMLVRTLVIYWNSFVMYRFQVRVYYVSSVFNRKYLGCINLRCCLKCFVSSFLKINFKN